jgi:ABC-type polysaccharide/polyol phosphate export permease
MTLKSAEKKQNKPFRGITFVTSLVRNRELWWRLTEREVIGRYRGSILG